MKTDYERIEATIHYLEDHFKEQPSLDTIATKAGLSPSHFQKLFKRWAGLSPKQFLDVLTLQYSKNLLDNKKSVLEVALDSGLSGPGRLHDLFVNLQAMTPGEYKKAGADLTINYGFHETPFGLCLLAVTERGICSLFFIAETKKTFALEDLKKTWPLSHLNENSDATAPYTDLIFKNRSSKQKLNLFVKGTHLQCNVWRALLSIPENEFRSYQEIAASVNNPTATRAVASAVGANLISYIIPCHRVLRKTGAIGGYRWGIARKRAMLTWEAAQGCNMP